MSKQSIRPGPGASENEAEIKSSPQLRTREERLGFRLALWGVRPAGNRALQMLLLEKAI